MPDSIYLVTTSQRLRSRTPTPVVLKLKLPKMTCPTLVARSPTRLRRSTAPPATIGLVNVASNLSPSSSGEDLPRRDALFVDRSTLEHEELLRQAHRTFHFKMTVMRAERRRALTLAPTPGISRRQSDGIVSLSGGRFDGLEANVQV